MPFAFFQVVIPILSVCCVLGMLEGPENEAPNLKSRDRLPSSKDDGWNQGVRLTGTCLPCRASPEAPFHIGSLSVKPSGLEC